MQYDPYQMCPCGSGKKLKFCCHDIVHEMTIIEQLHEANQNRMALQKLEKLEKSHPNRSWIATFKGMVLLNEDRGGEAKAALVPLLKSDPMHPLANLLFAMSSFNADGYPASSKPIHRAFKLCAGTFNESIGILLAGMASYFMDYGHPMAARQHLVMALRHADERIRRQIFMQLLELDGDSSIAYPLRSVHNAVACEPTEQTQEKFDHAVRLSAVCCWGEAADDLQEVAEQDGDSAALWHNVGLFRAWDGDTAAAAEAFHQAADQYDDMAKAIECETLSQLLKLELPEHGIPQKLEKFNLKGVSRLLTVLDDVPTAARVDDPQEEESQTNPVAARYVLLDRSLDELPEPDAMSTDDVPKIIGRVVVFDQVESRPDEDDVPAQAFVIGLEGDELEAAIASFRDSAGDLAEPVSDDDSDIDDVEGSATAEQDTTGEDMGDEVTPEADNGDWVDDLMPRVPAAQIPYMWNAFFPPRFPGHVRRRLESEQWQRLFDDVWPNTESALLDGRTAADLGESKEDRVKLAASLNMLDAFCDARRYIFPRQEMEQKYDAPTSEPLVPDAQTPLSSFSVAEIHRLNLQELTPEQFKHVLNRVLLIGHAGLLHAVLQEALRRPVEELEEGSRERAYSSLVDVCRHSLRTDEALEWIEKARAELTEGDDAFEKDLEWKSRELTVRMEDPSDPRFSSLLKELWETFGAKLPQLRGYLSNLVQMLDIDPPWGGSIVTPQAESAGVGSGWNPPAPGEPAGGEKKLWLPGQ